MSWEERMSAKHQKRPAVEPRREPTFRERIWWPHIGRMWAPWFRWRLPRLICRTCYNWQLVDGIRWGFRRVCDRDVCKHRHHHLEVWLA